MIQFLKRFFTDETAFVGLIRAALLGLGGMAATGNLPIPPEWAAVIMAAGGFVRAGEKNQ